MEGTGAGSNAAGSSLLPAVLDASGEPGGGQPTVEEMDLNLADALNAFKNTPPATGSSSEADAEFQDQAAAVIDGTGSPLPSLDEELADNYFFLAKAVVPELLPAGDQVAAAHAYLDEKYGRTCYFRLAAANEQDGEGEFRSIPCILHEPTPVPAPPSSSLSHPATC